MSSQFKLDDFFSGLWNIKAICMHSVREICGLCFSILRSMLKMQYMRNDASNMLCQSGPCNSSLLPNEFGNFWWSLSLQSQHRPLITEPKGQV